MKQELFDKRYVCYIPDEKLIGKIVFYADDFHILRDRVNRNEVKELCEFVEEYEDEDDLDYPFGIQFCGRYKFVYYDPNYEYKRAFSKGDIVEIRINKYTDTWRPVERLEELDDPNGIYRICEKLEEKEVQGNVTYEELAQWLTKGKGLVMDTSMGYVSTGLKFTQNQLGEEVEDFLILRYGEKEWHKPTKEYIEEGSE